MRILSTIFLTMAVCFSNSLPIYIHSTPTIVKSNIGKGFDTSIDFEGENVSVANYLPIPQYPNLLVTFHVRGINVIGTKNPVRLEAPMFGAIITQPTSRPNVNVSLGYIPVARKDSLQVSERVNGLWGSMTLKQLISRKEYFAYSVGLYLPFNRSQHLGAFANSFFHIGENTTFRIEGIYHPEVGSTGISIEHETGIIAFKTGVEWLWKDRGSPQTLRYIGITVHFYTKTKQ